MRRFKHNLSHTKLLTCNMGELVPIACVEALPGDTIQHNSSALIRVSPLAAPVMHKVKARIHHFFVPNRLLWDGWEDFITGGPDGNNADVVPKVGQSTAGGSNVLDYLGVPVIDGLDVNALPVRAYNKIYNEYYRDQDLNSEADDEYLGVHPIKWGKDYFTTARPWTQKGPDVTIPLGDLAPIKGLGVGGAVSGEQTGVKETGGGTVTYAHHYDSQDTGNTIFGESDPAGNPTFYADLANATGADINDVRKAFAIQRYQEARARYGSRYTEYLRYLGARPLDQRLQRPEFLGGGVSNLNFSEVLQTSNGTDPRYGVGDMYGHGIAAMRSNRYRRTIEEHGFIISLLSVRPESIYTQGVHRQWLRVDKEDYFQKELAEIGQQQVYNNEVYAVPGPSGDETFGYQDRYAEYRQHPSDVCKEFRDTLDYWHLGRKFDSAPALNASFVNCKPTKRIYNDQVSDGLWVQVHNKMIARRIVPRNATPRVL